MKKIFSLSAILMIFFSISYAQEDNLAPNWFLMPDNEKKADSLIEMSWLYILDGNWDLARGSALKGQQLSQKINYKIGIASSFMRLGVVSQYADKNYKKAEEQYRKAFQIRQAEGNTLGAVRVCNNLIGVLRTQGNLKEAEIIGEQGLAMLKTIVTDKKEFLSVKAKLKNLLGAVYRSQLKPLKALQQLEESLTIRRKLNTRNELAKTLLNLGNFYSEDIIGNYEKAKKYFQEGLQLTQIAKDTIHEHKMLLALGNIHFHLNEFKEAISYYRQVQAMSKESDSDDYTKALRNIGDIFFVQDKPLLALKEWLKCEKAFKYSNNSIELPTLFTDIGKAYHQLSKNAKAHHYLELGLETADRLNNVDSRIYARNNLAIFYANKGNYKKSHLLNQQSLVLQDSLSRLAQDAMIYKTNMEQERREKVELEYKQTQLEKEQVELANQNLKQLGLLIFCGLSLLIGFAFFYAYANKKNRQIAWQEVDNLLYEQELKMTYARLEGRSIEREQIARDLHDRLGGMLATVKLYFAPIEAKLDRIQEDSKKQYNKAINLLDESCEEVRRISQNMISSSLKEYGLKYVLEEMGERIQHSNQLIVDVDTFGLEERFDRKIEIQIYRIIQELVSNALKHANAKKLTIQLNYFDNVINIMVEDNGLGFSTLSNTDKSKGIGLDNISRRVRDLNGTWNIDSVIGRGTTVSVDIPV